MELSKDRINRLDRLMKIIQAKEVAGKKKWREVERDMGHKCINKHIMGGALEGREQKKIFKEIISKKKPQIY